MRTSVVVGLLMVALSAAAPAWAHHEPPITQIAPATTSPPVIDGVIDPAEWGDALSYPLDFAGHPGSISYEEDGTYLYAAVTIGDTDPFNPNFTIFFDNNHDGLKDFGDDAILAFLGHDTGQDFFFNPDGSGGTSHYNDTTNDGSNDVDGAGAITDSGTVTFEFRHPLMSSDSRHDIQAKVGDTLGVDYQYESGLFVRYPGADVFDPSNWADLVLSAAPADDTTPPTVTVTSPEGGSDLRGTVDVTADASDNIGVDHVDFSFFDGSEFIPLGSDSTPPYTVPFDTRQFDDFAHNSGTVYAQAFDIAGNASIKSGVGVGIDNTPPQATLTAPNTGAVVSGTLVFGGTAFDPPAEIGSGVAAWSFEYRRHNSEDPLQDAASGTDEGTVTGSWHMSDLADGLYDVSLKVQDNAGNVTRTPTRTIRIDNSSPDGIFRIDAGDITSLDPANVTDSQAQQVLYATCAKLVNAPDRSGQASLEHLSPEVATALPTVSTDRLSYTFTIASGWKFSDGTDVTAQSFVRALERALAPGTTGFGPDIFQYISGAHNFNIGETSTIRGVNTDGNVLTIQLTQPDETFLAKLATSYGCAVPADTPLAEQPGGLPSAGPYFIASYVPGQQLILSRNPNYTGSRPHVFDRFVYTLGKSQFSAEGDVLEGVADYSAVGVPNSEIASLDKTYGPNARVQRYFQAPRMGLRYVVFNTKRRAFGTAAVRRAVASVLDRASLAAAQQPGSITDQLIPPNSAGFNDYSIFPNFVTDYSAAAAVVSSQDLTGATVNVYAADSPQLDAPVASVQSVLERVGLAVNVVREPFAQLLDDILSGESPVNVSLVSWQADYPDPQDFTNVLLDPTSGNDFSHFDDGTELARMATVAAIPPGPGRYAEYQKLDLELSQGFAPMTAYATMDATDFFTARVGCQTFNPYFGTDLRGALPGAEVRGVDLTRGGCTRRPAGRRRRRA